MSSFWKKITALDERVWQLIHREGTINFFWFKISPQKNKMTSVALEEFA